MCGIKPDSGGSEMTEKDKGLIKLARSASRFNYEFIDSLIQQAESEEAKQELEELGRIAFRSAEIQEFDTRED